MVLEVFAIGHSRDGLGKIIGRDVAGVNTVGTTQDAVAQSATIEYDEGVICIAASCHVAGGSSCIVAVKVTSRFLPRTIGVNLKGFLQPETETNGQMC